MGGKGSKNSTPEPASRHSSSGPDLLPRSLPAGRSFECTLQDTDQQFFLTVGFPNLYVSNARKELLSTFPIKFLRGYGQQQHVFSFEAGRKCPGGARIYFYEIHSGEDVFLALNEAVAHHNDGVGGDRYDHLPHFQKQPSTTSNPGHRVERKHSVASIDGSAPSSPYEQPTSLSLSRNQSSRSMSNSAAGRVVAGSDSTYNTLHGGGGGGGGGESFEFGGSGGDSYASLNRAGGVAGSVYSTIDEEKSRAAASGAGSRGGRGGSSSGNAEEESYSMLNRGAGARGSQGVSSNTYSTAKHSGSKAGGGFETVTYDVLGDDGSDDIVAEGGYEMAGGGRDDGAYDTMGGARAPSGEPYNMLAGADRKQAASTSGKIGYDMLAGRDDAHDNSKDTYAHAQHGGPGRNDQGSYAALNRNQGNSSQGVYSSGVVGYDVLSAPHQSPYDMD